MTETREEEWFFPSVLHMGNLLPSDLELPLNGSTGCVCVSRNRQGHVCQYGGGRGQGGPEAVSDDFPSALRSHWLASRSPRTTLSSGAFLYLQLLSTRLKFCRNPIGGEWPNAARFFFTEQMNTPEQILSVLKVCKEPKWPSQCSIPGMSDFDPTHQAEKLKLFEKLHGEGFLTRVPGATGVRTGKGFVITEKGRAELQLLLTHPAIAKTL
jgi:hypothetical protein